MFHDVPLLAWLTVHTVALEALVPLVTDPLLRFR